METSVQLLNEREAARVLAVSCAALRRWRRERRGPELFAAVAASGMTFVLLSGS